MSRTLTFREEDAIRRAGVVEIVCSEADGGRVFTLDAKAMARRIGSTDFAFFIEALIDAGMLLPGFILPNQFLPSIVMRASPNIRRVLAQAQNEAS